MSSSVPLGDSGLFDGFYGGGGGHGHDYDLGRLGASTSSAVLDGNTPEAEAPRRKQAGDRGEKAAMALKSHSEAERRRRERINAHLATLRTMLPCTDTKMDKAALLAEVIAHVKKLKANAARVSTHCAVPADADDVAVELVPSPSSLQATVKATLSCDDGADLFADVRQALQPLGLRVVGSEVTTLGGRVRCTFLLLTTCGGDDDDAMMMSVVESVRQALQSVLDKANDSAPQFAPRASLLLNKRRRVASCTFDSSSSSS
ncbi:hypothetical protein ACP4OV_031352 [Aristida adscensionis]